MKHLFVLLSLLLAWSGAQAQNEKQTPVTKLPGEENLSLRERAERDFLMPVRRKKAVAETPKATAEDNTAAPELDATAHYSESAEEAREAAVPAHTTRSYEARHTEWLAARRTAARREEARLEARAEARRAARHSLRSHGSSRISKAKAHKATSHSNSSKSSKSKAKSKSAVHSSKSTSKSKGAKAKSSTKKSASHRSESRGSTRKSSAHKAATHKTTKKSTPSKSKVKTKSHRR